MKYCPKCQKNLPLCEFNKNKTQPDGLCTYCRLCTAEYKTEWRLRNKTHIETYQVKWLDENPNYHKNWYQENKDYRAEYDRDWKLSNPEKKREYGRRRRALKKSKVGFMPENYEQLLWESQKGICYYCQEALVEFHLEHKVPLSRGGAHDFENVCLSCPSCNVRKHIKTEKEFVKQLS